MLVPTYRWNAGYGGGDQILDDNSLSTERLPRGSHVGEKLERYAEKDPEGVLKLGTRDEDDIRVSPQDGDRNTATSRDCGYHVSTPRAKRVKGR